MEQMRKYHFQSHFTITRDVPEVWFSRYTGSVEVGQIISPYYSFSDSAPVPLVRDLIDPEWKVIVVSIAIIGGIIYWYGWGLPAHEAQVHLSEGWIAPTGWDCPPDHPIKANLRSMIYHLPGDPYWDRTNALNGECFDTAAHAEAQGFRPIYTN